MADLSYEETCQLIDQIYDVGVMSVCYSHGENMLHKDFWRITEYMRDRDMYVILMTNGTLIRSRETAEQLHTAGVRMVYVSLDSLTPARHDARRGVPHSFDKAMQALRLLRETGKFQLGISFVLDEYNWLEVDAVVGFALSEQLQRVNFLTIRPNNRPVDFNLDEYRTVVQKLVDHKQRLKNQLRVMVHDPLVPLLADCRAYSCREVEMLKLENACEAGRTFFSIAPDGTVRGCNLIDFAVGNVHDEPLAQVLERFASDIYGETGPSECHDCLHQSFCHGGCKSFATVNQHHFDLDQRCRVHHLKVDQNLSASRDGR